MVRFFFLTSTSIVIDTIGSVSYLVLFHFFNINLNDSRWAWSGRKYSFIVKSDSYITKLINGFWDFYFGNNLALDDIDDDYFIIL